jgi:hypothetical protein
MIIKLPIIEENKIIIKLFKLEKKKDYLLLSNLNILNESNESFKTFSLSENASTPTSTLASQTSQTSLTSLDTSQIKICGCNKTNGMNFINIYLPLKLNIIDNKYLWFYYFFNISLISDLENNIDFFSVLNKNLISNFNLKLMTINNLNTLSIKIWKIALIEYQLLTNNKIFYNLEYFTKNLWEIINLNLNLSIFLIWLDPNYTNKSIKDYQQKHQIPKKIILLGNSLKNIKFKINLSNEYTIIEHFDYIKNNPLKINNIEINKSYFIKINEHKYFLIKIDNINNDIIKSNNYSFEFNKYNWYYYPPNLQITNNYVIINFFHNKNIYYESINKYNSNIDLDNLDKIINYFMDTPFKSNLIYFINKSYNDIEISDFEILNSNSYDHIFFKYIVNKYNDINKIIQIINILFCHYTYPIKFNKYEIDNIFDNILYISLFNLKKILLLGDNDNKLLIPHKVKMLYYTILKLFSKLINNPTENIYNYKFFHDNLYKKFIKIFFFEDCNSFILLKELINNDIIIKQIKIYIQDSFFLIDILNKITWSNIFYRLPYFKFIIKNKIIFYQDKINKNIITDSYDNKIKNIIQNPYDMINNIKTLDEYIIWFNFLDFKLDELFNNKIILSPSDINNLAKLIYLLYNIKEQDIKDINYENFLTFASSNLRLIVYNQQINIKIKEVLKFKVPLNLGILAKYLNKNLLDNKVDKLDKLDKFDKLDKNADIDITILKNQLICITKKYIKYKSKYNNIKTEISPSNKK